LQAAFDAAGVSSSIVNAEGDATKQATQADQAITNGAKVIVFVDLDSGSGAAIIAKARAANVHIIDYDRLTIQGPGADFYVSFDNVAVGRLEGQGVVDGIAAAGLKNPVVAELNGSPTDNNATLFKQGYDSVLQPLYDNKTYTKGPDQSVPGWDNQKALTIFEQMLTAQNNKIDAVAAANDGLAGAVASALENQKLPYVPVSGQDATVEGIQRVIAGRQSMTVYKAVKQEANAAAALAIALVKGTDTKALATGTADNTDGGKNAAGNKSMPAVLLVPVAVYKSNVGQTVLADGFRTVAEVCVGDFAKYCPANWAMMAAGMAATKAP
ncbi:MAG TPA: substrate-binding domain-containing protein, partial [Aggregatilineales bacterium]|nr:substrate-binding domain-containing protein [Aggregatilineales bacterium]